MFKIIVFIVVSFIACLLGTDAALVPDEKKPILEITENGRDTIITCNSTYEREIQSIKIGNRDDSENNSVTCCNSEFQTPRGTFLDAEFSTCTRDNMKGLVTHRIIWNDHSLNNGFYICEICYSRHTYSAKADCSCSEAYEFKHYKSQALNGVSPTANEFTEQTTHQGRNTESLVATAILVVIIAVVVALAIIYIRRFQKDGLGSACCALTQYAKRNEKKHLVVLVQIKKCLVEGSSRLSSDVNSRYHVYLRAEGRPTDTRSCSDVTVIETIPLPETLIKKFDFGQPSLLNEWPQFSGEATQEYFHVWHQCRRSSLLLHSR